MKLRLTIAYHAIDAAHQIKDKVGATLAPYAQQVHAASVSLQPAAEHPEQFDCLVTVRVRFWGKLVVRKAGADPLRTLDRALEELDLLLLAFLADLQEAFGAAG